MAINKVIYGSTVLIDLTADTVAADKVAEGIIFHAPDGTQQVGTMADAGHLLNLIEALPETFYTKTIADQLLADAITAHNTDPAAHGDTRQRIADLEAEVAELEIIIGPAIDTNPFTTTFTTLAGKVVTGVWNDALGRIEF